MSNLNVSDLLRARIVLNTVHAELTTPPLSGRTVVLSPWARLRMTLEANLITTVVMDVQAEVHEARASMITWPVSGMALATLGPLTYGGDLTAWATRGEAIISYVLRDLSLLYRPRFDGLREHLVTTPIAWEVTDAMLRLGER